MSNLGIADTREFRKPGSNLEHRDSYENYPESYDSLKNQIKYENKLEEVYKIGA